MSDQDVGGERLPAKRDLLVTTEAFAICPACGKAMAGQVAWEVEIDKPDTWAHNPPADTKNKTATLKPVGVNMGHNCMPKVTR